MPDPAAAEATLPPPIPPPEAAPPPPASDTTPAAASGMVGSPASTLGITPAGRPYGPVYRGGGAPAHQYDDSGRPYEITPSGARRPMTAEEVQQRASGGASTAGAEPDHVVSDGVPTTVKATDPAIGFINWIGQNEGADWGTLYGNAPGWSGKLTTTGVPIVNGRPWEGGRGKDGRPTHAFGKGQFQPDTWVRYARKLNIDVTDASTMNQARVMLAIAQDHDPRFLDKFAAGDRAGLAAELSGEWPSLAKGGGRGSTLSEQWNSDLPPTLKEAFDYSKAARERLDALQEQFQRMMGQAAPGDSETHLRAERVRGQIDQAMEDWQALSKRTPIEKPVDIWHNFGLAAGIAMLLGGLAGRNHLTAALSAGGAALQAINANNHEQYEQAYKTWKQQTDYGIDLIKLKSAELDSILQDRKMGMDEKLSQLKLVTELAGMTSQSAALAKGDITEFALLQNSLNRGTTQAMTQAQNLDRWNRYQTGLQAKLDTWQKDPANVGKEMPADVRVHLENQAAAEAGLPGAVGGATYQAKQSAELPPGWTDSTIKFWAGVLRNGGALPPGLARSSSGSNAVIRIMAEMGATGDVGQFIANHATVAADTGSLRNMTRMADAAVSFERTARANFELALRLAPEAVPSSLGPFFNRWVEEGEKMFGDPGVPRYVTAMLTAANEYAKIMSGSTGAQGSTVDSRREAATLFSPYLSQEQISGVVAVAEKDMENRRQYLYGQIDDIKDRLRAAGSGQPTATQGQSREPQRTGVTPVPKEHIMDPDGTKYRASDGKTYVKHGVEMVPE